MRLGDMYCLDIKTMNWQKIHLDGGFSQYELTKLKITCFLSKIRHPTIAAFLAHSERDQEQDVRLWWLGAVS